MTNIKEVSLNEPWDRELTFREAIERAEAELRVTPGTIILLQLHPNGQWTAQYLLE